MVRIVFIIAMLCISVGGMAQRVSVHACNEPAAAVFTDLMRQTGKNFVYSTDILREIYVTVDAVNRPLGKVLDEMFRNTDIEYRIKGKNVILRRRKVARRVRKAEPLMHEALIDIPQPEMLNEIIVVSRLEAPVVETAEIGAKKITGSEIISTPVLLGESDVIKALHMQPGISEGTEGMAGMHVHGGNADENLYMLDNVPLYQVNHFMGLFSAFNPEVIRYIDFFKSSIPAKYDGRLSSFLDVRTRDGSPDGHHGAARLGLTSGEFNIGGPIGRRTTYMAAIRRSWYDVLTIPILALVNAKNEEEKISLNYYFMDINAKISHRFNDRAKAFINVYFGDDMLKSGSRDKWGQDGCWYENDRYDMHWGNMVVQAGMNYCMRPGLTAEFTAAYTRYFSRLNHEDFMREKSRETIIETYNISRMRNNISDWIFRADFDWLAADKSRVRFGANYTRHSFLPMSTGRSFSSGGTAVTTNDSTTTYGANEFNVYIEDDWRISESLMVNAGVHASLFDIDGRLRHGISPRLSLAWRMSDATAMKAAYSRTTQYVHQLTQSYMALPTDQWIPVTGDFKPQTADKVSAGVYWQSADGMYAASVEGYYKWMRNLIAYRDEYYLKPPMEVWNARLTSGSGTAKGIDFKVEKTAGRLTGHIAYSLARTDRIFADKNGGLPFPARFDNRHTINVLLNWKVNDRVQLNAAWTGHSGNRFTLLTQVWDAPDMGDLYYDNNVPLRTGVNNYQLPFYHRLDLSCMLKNSRGYWTFGLYNAYCHMNTIAIRHAYTKNGRPVFQKVKLLPIIPSISYTWLF